MNPYSLFRLGDDALERDMLDLFAEDGPRIALEIAHIAEFDARRLYAGHGFPSLLDYLVLKARLSDAAALKRIRSARAAREHPELFEALVEGRLHLTAVVLLAPRLSRANVDELITAATHKTVEAIRQLLAERFPKRDVPLSMRPAGLGDEVVSKPVAGEVVLKPPAAAEPGRTRQAGEPAARAKVAPLAPGRYETRFTMGQAAHEAMRYFEQLLGRKVTSKEMDGALEQGFKAMAAALEKRRFGATDKPKKQGKAATGRRIPNAIKRAVWQRDEGRCTFVAGNGRRCEQRGDVEFDHIEPVARGGTSTAGNLRLLCRAHNQYEAERAYGAGFMHEKRERAKHMAEGKSEAPAAGDTPPAPVPAPVRAPARRPAPKAASAAGRDAKDIVPCLRHLGFRIDEARQAAAHCDSMGDSTLEQRLRAALSFLAPTARVTGAPRFNGGSG